MKIAFVGKGGSGKSTMSALFVRYLQKHKNNTLVVDADINMNLSGLLGVDIDKNNFLSHPEVANSLRTYFKGSNKRISDASQFLPTTPPGNGSNLIQSVNDKVLKNYFSKVSETPEINLLTVGTYDSKGIGETCYHSHLFVAENLLTHTLSENNFHVVCDMVAGTDAFAYSMHLQFDGIFLITEPTPESVEVCRLYLGLARESGVSDLVHIIGNKIEDDQDLDYITKSVGKAPIHWLPALPVLKKARQKGNPIDVSMIDDQLESCLAQIEKSALNPKITNIDRMQLLQKLHLKLNEKQWVQNGYGDVSGQIDPSYNFPTEKVLVSVQ